MPGQFPHNTHLFPVSADRIIPPSRSWVLWWTTEEWPTGLCARAVSQRASADLRARSRICAASAAEPRGHRRVPEGGWEMHGDLSNPKARNSCQPIIVGNRNTSTDWRPSNFLIPHNSVGGGQQTNKQKKQQKCPLRTQGWGTPQMKTGWGE